MLRLVKQRIEAALDHLILTMQSCRDGPRPGADTAMSAGVAGPSDAAIAALAHHAASR